MKPVLSFEEVRKAIIGQNFMFQTPYGKRLLTYADYTASGRSLKFIEQFLIKIQREYANTHTEDDVTGRNMTKILNQAETNIKKAFNAENNCRIIATGTGATGAISKFQEIIGIRLPPATKELLRTIFEKSATRVRGLYEPFGGLRRGRSRKVRLGRGRYYLGRAAER